MKTKPKFELMSMEDLSRLIRNEGHDRLLREGAARELAKRENNTIDRVRYQSWGQPPHVNIATYLY